MLKRNKVIILFILSWVGTVLLLAAGLIRLPTFLDEREKLLNLKAKLADSKSQELKMKVFLDGFKNDTALMKADISKRENLVSKNTFSCRPESSIPEFVNELQQLFSDSGASIINLGYEKREIFNGFVILPFSAEFRASYQGMRKVLHSLETNSAGVLIENLDLLSLDDEEHKVKMKARCTVRFKQIGQ